MNKVKKRVKVIQKEREVIQMADSVQLPNPPYTVICLR